MSAAALVAGLLLSTAASAEQGDAEGLQLQADRIVVEQGSLRGEGAVRAPLQGGMIHAERVELALDGSRVVLEDGCWERSDGRLCFARLELLPDGVALLDGVSLSLCACDGPRQPWSVQAWRVRVEPERGAVFVGGLLRVAGCPVLPLPAGVFPLGPRRSGLLAPRVAWTRDGLELGQPVFLALGQALDLTLEPAWRQQRGVRLDSELRWDLPREGGGELDLSAGWDSLDQALRGMVDVEHGYVDRSLRSAVSGSLASDPDYRDDFELDFTRRQQGYHELRGLLGLGPLRLDHDGLQAPGGASQRLVGLVASRPSRDAEAISPSASLDLGLGGYGSSPVALARAWLLARPALGLAVGRPLGALELEGAVLGEGLLVQPLEPTMDAVSGDALSEARLDAELRAALPLWGEHGPLRHLLRPSVVLGGALAVEQPGFDELYPRLGSSPALWLGPRVESRWLSSTAVPITLRAELPWSDLGLTPALQAWWRQGPWWGRLQGSATLPAGEPVQDGLAWLEAGRQTEVLTVAAGVLVLQEAEPAGQLSARAAWQLPWGADRWEPRARARWSVADGAFVEQQLGLYYASRCDCLGLEIGATWAEDRDAPTLGMRVDLGR